MHGDRRGAGALTRVASLVLAATPLAACEPTENQVVTIMNEVVAVSISDRDAGAICSVVHQGMELVNDHDHGRQIQVAWSASDLGEAYNPTEAGSSHDGVGQITSSRLLRVEATTDSLTTVSRPAYWRRPGPHSANIADVSADVLSKTITLGSRADPHVLVFDTRITLAALPNGPPVTSLRVEAPTWYGHPGLCVHALMDVHTGEYTLVPSRGRLQKDQLNERIRLACPSFVVPILSTPDGSHALGMIAGDAAKFWAYFTHEVPSDDESNACVKMTAFYRHDAEDGDTFEYRTFLVVGTLREVRASLMKLGNELRHAPLHPPPAFAPPPHRQ